MPRSKKVWIADDDESIRFILEKGLMDAGFNVNVFEDGNVFDTSLYHTMIGLMSKVVDDILPDYRPIRIRGILQTPIKDDIIHYPPHTDTTDSGGFSAIYYVTDATGDTFLFKEKDINDEIEHTKDEINSIENKQVQSKKSIEN